MSLEENSVTRVQILEELFAFHVALIPLGKVWIQLCSSTKRKENSESKSVVDLETDRLLFAIPVQLPYNQHQVKGQVIKTVTTSGCRAKSRLQHNCNPQSLKNLLFVVNQYSVLGQCWKIYRKLFEEAIFQKTS